jgi:tetratricopeptide (TPR) repeat protein
MIAYTITYILTGILFFYTFFKWSTDQYSSLIFYTTLIGCLITLGGFVYFPLNIIVLLFAYFLPLIVNYFNNRALNILRQDEYNTCYRLIKRNPTNAAAFAKLGNLLEGDKKYKDALEAYENSLNADDMQKDIERRYQALVEKLALEESSQVHCPGCYTIVPVEYGKCWKCDRIYDRQKYILSIIKKKGLPGIIALSITGLALFTTIFILIATINRLFTSLFAVSISLTLTLAFSYITYLIFKDKK